LQQREQFSQDSAMLSMMKRCLASGSLDLQEIRIKTWYAQQVQNIAATRVNRLSKDEQRVL
jgi:hypothetical protein